MSHRPRLAARGRRIKVKLKRLNETLKGMAGPDAVESTISAARKRIRLLRRTTYAPSPSSQENARESDGHEATRR